MGSTTTSGADDLRAAAADLELIAKARDAVTAAEEHLDGMLREVVGRRLVTAKQVGEALGIDRRSVYKRLAR